MLRALGKVLSQGAAGDAQGLKYITDMGDTLTMYFPTWVGRGDGGETGCQILISILESSNPEMWCSRRDMSAMQLSQNSATKVSAALISLGLVATAM